MCISRCCPYPVAVLLTLRRGEASLLRLDAGTGLPLRPSVSAAADTEGSPIVRQRCNGGIDAARWGRYGVFCGGSRTVAQTSRRGILLWDTHTGLDYFDIPLGADSIPHSVCGLEAGPFDSGRTIATASLCGQVSVLCVRSGQQVCAFSGPQRSTSASSRPMEGIGPGAWGVSFGQSEHNPLLACAAWDGKVRVMCLRTRKEFAALELQSSCPKSRAMSVHVLSIDQ